MKKLMQSIKKNYIYVNITFLLLSIYIILFPFFSKLLGKINPNLNRCYYLVLTGKPCPLCGGTRYIEHLPENIFKNPKYLLHPFGIIMFVVLIEFISRTYCILTRKNEKSDRFIIIDVILHIFILISFIAYEVIFFIVN